MEWTVGLVQFEPVFGEKVSNLDRVESLLKDIRADLVVLPELFATGYLFQNSVEVNELAETIPDGITCKRLIEWSSRWHMAIVAGIAEKASPGIYNSALLIDGDSGSIEIYRKVHLYNEEKLWFRPGDLGFNVFPVRCVKIGIMICFDWLFPEACRTLALQGAQVIAHPSNLVMPYCQKAMPIRSLENHVFCVTANRTGKDSRPNGQSLSFTGQSIITAPDSSVLLSLNPTEVKGVSIKIDPTLSLDKHLTLNNDIFLDRRPRWYEISKMPCSHHTSSTNVSEY